MNLRPVAFSVPSFRTLWLVSITWGCAHWMERVATGWLALQTGGGTMAVGITFAARLVPALLLGLASGTMADRVDRRRVLIIVGLAGAALAVLLGTLVSTGTVSLWQVAMISFLNGCIFVTEMPSRQALIVDMVGRGEAANALALNAIGTRLSGAIGALTGGVVISALGTGNSYYLVAVCYVIGAVIVTRIARPTTKSERHSAQSFRKSLSDAAQMVLRQPAVRTLVIVAMLCEVFGFSYMTAVPSLARDVLRAGPEGLGAMTAASSLGATVAVMIVAMLPRAVRREPLLAIAFACYGISLVTLSFAPTLSLALVSMFIIGSCASAFDVFQQASLQLAVPDHQRGRAVGAWVLSLGAGPIGHLEVGALATAIGPASTLLVNGLLLAASSLMLVLSTPDYRWQRNRVPTSPIQG